VTILANLFTSLQNVCAILANLFASLQKFPANVGAGLHESVRILALLHIRVQIFTMNANCRASELEYGVQNFALFWQIAHES
jgi:hypothetical protein